MSSIEIFLYPTIGALGVWMVSYGIYDSISKKRPEIGWKIFTGGVAIGFVFGAILHGIAKSHFGI